jgi:hypothetical protein
LLAAALALPGESMMERLGFRGDVVLCVAAAKVGLSHFEVSSTALKGTPGNSAAGAHRLAEELRVQGKETSFSGREPVAWSL